MDTPGRHAGLQRRRRGRGVSGQAGDVVSGQRGHGVSQPDGGAGAIGRRLHAVRRDAHARAPDWRSGRCLAPDGRADGLLGYARLSAVAYPPGAVARSWRGQRAWRCIKPVSHRLAAIGAAHRTGADRARGGRADFQTLYRDHAESDAALRCAGRAYRLVEL